MGQGVSKNNIISINNNINDLIVGNMLTIDRLNNLLDTVNISSDLKFVINNYLKCIPDIQNESRIINIDNSQYNLIFDSLDLAISYIKNRGMDYKIVENYLYSKVKKSYSKNFTKDPSLEY